MISKFIQFVKTHSDEAVLFLGVVLISLLAFAAGYIARGEKEPLRFELHTDQTFSVKPDDFSIL